MTYLDEQIANLEALLKLASLVPELDDATLDEHYAPTKRHLAELRALKLAKDALETGEYSARYEAEKKALAAIEALGEKG